MTEIDVEVEHICAKVGGRTVQMLETLLDQPQFRSANNALSCLSSYCMSVRDNKPVFFPTLSFLTRLSQ